MTVLRASWAAFRADRSSDGGYVAVMTGLLLMVLMGIAAFAVDVGQWYVVGQQEQRAADAAALAGVTYLPANSTAAYATAQNFAKGNGFTNGLNATLVTPGLDGRPTRLRVTVTRTVDNIFGPLLGVPKTTISRTAVADYAGPVPLGSPCNEFGNDPEPGSNRSTNCTGTGQFWANVGSKGATKQSGDAYQDDNCTSLADRCSSQAASGANTDYDPNGYFYTVTLTQDVGSLTLQAFDPAWVAVGDNCDKNGLNGATNTRYQPGPTSPYCTGDTEIGSSSLAMATQFTVRKEIPTSNVWDPTSYPAVGGVCTKVFQGHDANDLNNPTANLTQISQGSLKISDVFRKWVTLCTISPAPMGTYMIQVNTNGLGGDDTQVSGHNRFGLRAYGTTTTENNAIAIAGYNKMAIYANLPAATTQFHLARVPPGAAGQVLNVSLFDVGDSKDSNGNPIDGTITVVPPADSNVGSTFSNCTGTPAAVSLTDCSLVANSNTMQGKWETIAVPIPSGYTCTLAATTGCWVKLKYAYGSGAHPNDTTSWTASIQGDPVRLVE